MFWRKFENLMKLSEEFGGAAPSIEDVEADLDDNFAKPEPEPDGDKLQDDGQKDITSGDSEIEHTKKIADRINEVRKETLKEAESKFAEERLRLIEELKSNDSNADYTEFLQAQGAVNPFTGQVIETVKDYSVYKKQFDEQNADAPDIEEVVNEKVNEAIRRQEEIHSMQRMIDVGVQKIGRINPNIRSVKDIESLPEAQTILQKVQRGYSLHDAYITSVSASKRVQKANTTEHMIPTGGSVGADSKSQIPFNELDSWKEDFPNDTIEKLTERYNKALKA